MRVLLIEDEQILRVSLAKELGKAGHAVEAHERPAAALNALAHGEYDVVVADIQLPGMDGFQLMEEAKLAGKSPPVIFMTAFATVRDAVRAMRLGAFDYLTKPFDVGELLVLLSRIHTLRALRDENAALKRRLVAMDRDDELGSAPTVRRLLDDLPLVAASDETVLITGETGTGKEHLARLIHVRSRRAEAPFVNVSCAALNAELIESELFGHEKGAFTGAHTRRIGRFEAANGGTLLLDDIDDVPIGIQVKLLHVLQDAVIERVGAGKTIHVDVRVIAATKADLGQNVEAGRFRQDLFYRINVLPMRLPPLRERVEDIPMLVERLLRRHSQGRPVAVTKDALDVLQGYAWPGNIRELENLLKRLLALVPSGSIGVDDLPEHIRHAVPRSAPPEGSGRYDEVIHRVERELLLEALRHANGNLTRAAQDLGLAPSTFRDKMSKLGLQR
jgi:DNA-binding NtrC family response regulator